MFYKTYSTTAVIVILQFFGMASSAVAETEMMTTSWYEEGDGCLKCPVFYDENGQPYHLLANGERFDDSDPTVAAHKELPLGTELLVTNPANGKTIVVVVQDRGPYSKDNGVVRDLDLSKAAAQKLSMLNTGVRKLIVTRLN